METVIIVSILIILVSAINAQSNEQNSWAKRVEREHEVATTLQFYFHDISGGPNPTSVRIAQATQTNNSSTFFGALVMIDDPLTIGPDPLSKIVGRARGLYGSSGLTVFSLIMAISYVFTYGIYDGSSFSLLSINQETKSPREMAIVGGTGLFRLARGYVIARTYSNNATVGAIVGYNVSLLTNKV
ncbi:Disease resistance-responsive family protein [Salvia divinorum]|uniref:Dirigent protein n=1 Tax=Salvia divinorum TaxID=28513 RepID=A0ABD1I8F7_SALDI